MTTKRSMSKSVATVTSYQLWKVTIAVPPRRMFGSEATWRYHRTCWGNCSYLRTMAFCYSRITTYFTATKNIRGNILSRTKCRRCFDGGAWHGKAHIVHDACMNPSIPKKQSGVHASSSLPFWTCDQHRQRSSAMTISELLNCRCIWFLWCFITFIHH